MSASEAVSTLRKNDRALAHLAVHALIGELLLHPKPGLVSPVDSGSHDDMDYPLMLRSAKSLEPAFTAIAAAGRRGASFESGLVPLGRQAERDMLRSTGGVNTHRGAIFIIGLLVAAAAKAGSQETSVTPDAIRETLLASWGRSLRNHAAEGRGDTSHGGIVFRRTGISGAREEAALGFPAVFEIALPTYESLVNEGHPRGEAAIHTLFMLLRSIDDTNVLFRGGQEAAGHVRTLAKGFLDVGGVRHARWRERAFAIHSEFVARRISPGGCADLLAATLFLSAITVAPSPISTCLGRQG